MKSQPRIRVLVIDDSAFSRRTIIRMLERSPLVEVADWAPDGQDALAKALENEYDLITLDLEMPRMDGFTFLRILMSRKPTPVIVVSGRGDNQDVFKALELGAVDFVAKPTPRATPELATIEQELIRKVHSIRELRLDRVVRPHADEPRLRVRAQMRPHRVVAIGCSTGGPAALLRLFSDFRSPPPLRLRGFAAHAAGLHRELRAPPRHHHALSRLRGRERHAGGRRRDHGRGGGQPSRVRVVRRRGGGAAGAAQPERALCAGVDRMFRSAAKHWGADLLALVLTGMGDDGAAGAAAVKRAGGNVIVESAETAVIYGMPQQAIRMGAVDAVLPLHEIAPLIESGLADPEGEDARSAE